VPVIRWRGEGQPSLLAERVSEMSGTKLRVNLYPSGGKKGAGGKVLIILPSDDWSSFLKKAGDKLSVVAERIFTEQGGEITALDEIAANDKLYVTFNGQPFRIINDPPPSTTTITVSSPSVPSPEQLKMVIRITRCIIFLLY